MKKGTAIFPGWLFPFVYCVAGVDAYGKSERLLQIYSRLVRGDVLSKKELAQQFHIAERSVQRDMESLRYFFAEQGLGQDVLFDSSAGGYRLERDVSPLLSNSETLAVCKILLESRSMRRDEMFPILDKLVACCVPEKDKRIVCPLPAKIDRKKVKKTE